MRHADTAPSHEQIPHVARIEAAQRDGIGIDIGIAVDGLELGIGEEARVLGVGIVQVNGPRHGGGTVLVEDIAQHVVLFQDVVAHQAPALALASHERHPCQAATGIAERVGHVVLQVAPVAVDDHHAIVAHALQPLRLVHVHACLPRPFAHRHALAALLREIHSISELRERRFPLSLLGIPHHGGAQRHRVGLLRGARLMKLVGRLAPHAIVGTGEVAHRAVARAVAEEGCGKGQFAPRLYVLCRHGKDAARQRIGTHDAVVQEQAYVLLIPDKVHLTLVFIEIGRLGIAALHGVELLLQVAQTRIGPHTDVSAHVHSYLRAVVTAQHGPIVYQSHLQAQPRCCDSCADTGRTSTAHHEIILPGSGGLIGQAQPLASQLCQRRPAGRRDVGGIGGEVEYVASSVEACQVVQRHRGIQLACPDLHLSRWLPLPCAPLGAQGLRRGATSVHQELECSGPGTLVPRRRPVVHASEYIIGGRGGKAHRRHGVGHGHAHAVGQQIGRPHLIHKLLVETPSATFGKLLCLHPYALSPHLRHSEAEGQQEEKYQAFHLRPTLSVFFYILFVLSILRLSQSAKPSMVMSPPGSTVTMA